MSQQLISLNKDLKLLRDKGYQLEIHGGHLIVHHIPYVNSKKEIQYGVLACELTLSGNSTIKPHNHVMKFSGEQPCDINGKVILGIKHGDINYKLPNQLVLNKSFSNKPKLGYKDYFEKMKTYADIITAPAKSIDDSVTEKPYEPIDEQNIDSVFNYYDTNSSRANIEHVNLKLKDQKIAILGLGGTGSYILDFVAKTCVSEIHLFDGDIFLNHNAFRSPGSVPLSTLKDRPFKVDYYNDIYSKLRKRIISHPIYIESENLELLADFDFVFICIDNNEVRGECVDFLKEKGISLIDVGIGVNLVNDCLIGTIRVTTVTNRKSDHIKKRIPYANMEENEYSTNIQISELNAFNACQAVIKWKKLSGFYQDLGGENHSTYSINVGQLLNEDNNEI